MAVDFGDHASGFRHTEVIRFINDEVLMNGGGAGFYVAPGSWPWNEVEDWLRTVLADPHAPHAVKRACAWSALALIVPVGARRREYQARQVQWLRDLVNEHDMAAWALASELQRLCGEREELAAQLQCARAALQQALDERNVLCGRVLKEEKTVRADQSPQEVMSDSGAEQCGATAWPVDVEEQDKMIAVGAQATQGSEVQAAAPAAALYVQAPWSSWAQTVQPSPPVQVSQPFPCHAPFPMGYSTYPPLSVVVEAGAAAAVTAQRAQMDIYPPGMWATEGAQEQTASLCDQGCCDKGGNSETLHGRCPLGDSKSHSQEQDLVCPQGRTSLEEIENHSQKEDLERSHGTAPLGDRSFSQRECPLILQEKHPLESRKSHSQEGPEMPQETSQLGSSRSNSVRRIPKKQQPQQQKAKHWKGKKASDSQHQGKPASQCNPKNWDCISCKAVNFSWRKACYKCKEVCMAVENGGLDPGQTH